MTLEETYPALAEQIRGLREAGVRESLIEQSVEEALQRARRQGYTASQIQGMTTRGLRTRRPDPRAGLMGGGASYEKELRAHQEEVGRIDQPPEQPGLMSAFGRGVLRGLTLGYAGESTPEHPLATIAGEILGGIGPGLALFAASAPVGGVAAGLVGASRFAPYAARFGPMAARLGLAKAVPGATATQLGSAGIGALAREAATGAAFGGLWKPEGEGGMGERLGQAGIGAVAAPPLALGLRAAARGIGALKGRLFPAPDMGARFPGMPPPGPGDFGGRFPGMPPEDPAADLARAFGQRYWPEGRAGGVANIIPAQEVPTRVSASMANWERGGRGWVETPKGRGVLRQFMRDARGDIWNEVQFGPDDIEWFSHNEIRPVSGPVGAGRIEAEPPPVPRATSPAPRPPGGPEAPPGRPRGPSGPKIPVITSSGQRVMRSVDALGLEDLATVEGVTVELRKAGDVQGFSVRARPDGQIEAVGKGGVDLFPDETAARDFVEGAARSGGPVPKQPVERTTAGHTSTLDKAMRGEKLGREDFENLERQKLANLSGGSSFAAEIADPARVEIEVTGLPDLGKAKLGSVPIRSRDDLAKAQAAARASGYRGEVLQVPGKGGEPTRYEMVYYLARSPGVNRAIALHRRAIIKGPADLSPGDLMFVRQMFGKGAGEIAAEMGDLRPPGPSATAGKPASTTWTKPPHPGMSPLRPEHAEQSKRDLQAFLDRQAEQAKAKAEGKPGPPEIAPEEERALIKSMDIRDAAEEADFPFGANVPTGPPGEARHVRIRGRVGKAAAEAEAAALAARKNLLQTLSWGTGGVDLDKPLSDTFWKSRGGLLERLGMTKDMTAGQIKERLQAGLPPEAPPEIPPVTGGSGPYQWKFAMPWVQPQLSQNPLVRHVGEQADKAAMAAREELVQLGVWGKARIIDPVGGKGTQADKRVAAMIRGDLPLSQATPAERGAVESWREAMAKIATAEGTPQQADYFTRVTDFDAIYQALREHFQGKVRLEDLDAKVAFRVGDPKRFAHLKKVFDGFPDWERVPRGVKTELKDLWQFNTVADTWDQLPAFLQERLPKEYFDRYLLPRTGQAPYMDSVVEAWQHRVPAAVKRIHYDPLIKTWNQALEQLPGPDLPLTEKRYIRTFLEGRLLGKPTATDQMIEYVSDRINLALGKPLTNIDQLQAAVTLFRSGFYRGALGIDSAFTNATQVLNNWAQKGKVIGPIWKHAQAFQDLKARGLVGQFTTMALEDFPTRERSALLDKILRWDQAATRAVLAPHSVAEMTNRGAAFAIGMEEAAARGMSPEAMLVNAYSRGTGIVPPLMLSEQVQHALFRVIPGTQFGMTPTQMAPALRGVLGRISSILVTYPTQQAAFEIGGLMQSGKAVAAHMRGKALSDGFADAVAAGDAGRLARFLTLTGMFTALPYIMYEVFGYGVNDTWGMKSVLDLTMNPFWKMIRNGYASIMGYTLADRDQARKELTSFYKTLVIPQYRWGKKAVDVVQGIERGYAVDSKARYLYNTSPWGELMRLAGVGPPERAQAQHLAKRLMMDAYEHRRDKRGAIDAILEGDLDAAQSFAKRWNEPITPQDIVRVQQERMRPVPQQFGRGLSTRLRQQATAEELGAL